MIIEFKNRTDTKELVHTIDNIKTSWASVSYMVLDLIAKEDGLSDIQIKTNSEGYENTVEYPIDGSLVFNLGDKNIIPGTYGIELSYVSIHGDIVQLIHEEDIFLVFKFSYTQDV